MKVLERRNGLQPESFEVEDILPHMKEYLSLCMRWANNMQNTKYCSLYILKTHKEYFE